MEPRQVFQEYEPLRDGLDDLPFCGFCGVRLVTEAMHGRSRKRCPDCRRFQFHNALPGAVVLVVDEDRYLMCRRTSSFRAGLWCLPGGVIEWDEDFLTAAIREVREETGVEVEIDSILTLTSNFFQGSSSIYSSHTIAVVLLGHATGGEPHGDGVETDQVRWFSIKEPLPDMAFEGDRHIIERYFEAPFAGAPVDPRLAK